MSNNISFSGKIFKCSLQILQIQEAEKRLGKVKPKEEEKSESSDAPEEEDTGPKAHVSLLDQHSELKKKAQG